MVKKLVLKKSIGSVAEVSSVNEVYYQFEEHGKTIAYKEDGLLYVLSGDYLDTFHWMVLPIIGIALTMSKHIMLEDLRKLLSDGRLMILDSLFDAQNYREW